MWILKYTASVSIISSLALGQGFAADNVQIQCPALTQEFILQHKDKFPTNKERGGDLPIDGQIWQVWNVNSYVKLNPDGTKEHGGNPPTEFTQVITQPGVHVEAVGPYHHKSETGIHQLICSYNYEIPGIGAGMSEASVVLIHELTGKSHEKTPQAIPEPQREPEKQNIGHVPAQVMPHATHESHHEPEKTTLAHNAPAYATAFVDLFKHGTINPHNFDQQISSNVFSGPLFMPNSIPAKELEHIASIANALGIKESIFKLFQALEAQNPNQMHNNNRKLFFLINHLLGNAETINLSNKYLEAGGLMPGDMAIYAYVLIDSGSPKEQEYALRSLNERINHDPARETHLPMVLQALSLVRDQKKVKPFINSIVKRLPEYRNTHAWIAFQVAATLFGNPHYHQEALTFIEDSLKLKEIQGQNPGRLIVQVLLQIPTTKEYAIKLFEEKILPNPAIEAKDKWQAIQHLLWTDRPKVMHYLDAIWKTSAQDNDRVGLIFEIMHNHNLREFLYPKIMENFDIILKVIKTMPEQEIGMKFGHLINFLSSLDHGALGRMQDKTNHLVSQIFQLPENALYQTQGNQLFTLIQKSGLNVEKILIPYSESPTVAPQFFINLCQDMPQKREFLWNVYKNPHTAPRLKAKILIEFARQINYDHALQQIVKKDDLISDLFGILETAKNLSLQEQIDIYYALVNFNDPKINENILSRMASQLKALKNTDQKVQLFQTVAYNHTIDKTSKLFEEMWNELLPEATNPNNAVQVRQQIINLLKHSNPTSPHMTSFTMLEQLGTLEDKIKREVYEINGPGGGITAAHAPAAIKRLKFIVDRVLQDFHSYSFQGVPFNQEDVIKKTKAILANKALMQQALGGLGAEMENYVEEAMRNVPILESETTWNEPNTELESTKIDGKTISMGQIYSLFIYYIDRQKSQGNDKAYVSLVGGLVQALASSDAMQKCKTGAMSGMGNTTFKEEFKEEKPHRTYGMVGENILHKATVLKTFLINVLADYKRGTQPFSTQNPHLIEEFKKVSQTNIGGNELLAETFQIFNQTPLQNIFGEKLHSIKKIIEENSDPKFIKDVHIFIINPALFALLSKEYSDIVAFTREAGKLNFTAFAEDTEDTIPYDPHLFKGGAKSQ